MSELVDRIPALLAFPGQEKLIDSEHPEKTLLERILEPYDRLVGSVMNMKERVILYGHSFGFFAALTALESMDREDAKNLAFRRGQIVRATEDRFEAEAQAAAAKGLDITQLGRTAMMRWMKVPPEIMHRLIDEHQLHISNDYGGIVITTGRKNALEQAASKVQTGNVTVLEGIGAAYHDPVRAEDAQTFSKDVEKARILKAKRPMLTSTNPRLIDHPDDIRAELVGMMTQPVILSEIIAAVKALGISFASDMDPNLSFTKLAGRFEDAKQWLQLNSPVKEFDTFTRLIRATAPA